MRSKYALTLLEVLVVVIIIGILASIGFVNYTGIKERALAKEATANLKLIAAAERIYRMENANNAYINCSCKVSGTGSDGCDNPTTGCNPLLKLSLNSQNWRYAVSSTTASTFTAYASRQPGGSGVCVYNLSHNDPDGEPNPNSYCP